MIRKEIHLRAVVLDVPDEDIRIGGFKHHLFGTPCADDFGRHICAPTFHGFGDALRLNHDQVRASIDKPFREPYRPFRIASPRSFEIFGARRTTSPKLDTDLRLSLEPGFLYAFN